MIIYQALFAWNEYIFALTFLNSNDTKDAAPDADGFCRAVRLGLAEGLRDPVADGHPIIIPVSVLAAILYQGPDSRRSERLKGGAFMTKTRKRST